MDGRGLDNGMEAGMVGKGRMVGGGINEEGRTLQTNIRFSTVS